MGMYMCVQEITVTWSNAPVCVAFSHAGEEEMFYFIKYTDICTYVFINLQMCILYTHII